uniref:GIY-YIG domain-containing protein n=1 Tax=viral metagenome TaxID=1070528 RepID=A0A6C0BMX7_9ZZZZ
MDYTLSHSSGCCEHPSGRYPYFRSGIIEELVKFPFFASNFCVYKANMPTEPCTWGEIYMLTNTVNNKRYIGQAGK